MGVNLELLLADDQLSNRFMIQFPEGVPGSSINPELMTLRLSESLDMPEYAVSKYEIGYRGMKLSKTGGGQESTNELQMQFRLDADWQVYNALKSWFDLVFDPLTGQYAPDNENRTTMVFTAFGARDRIVKQITFYWIRIFSLKAGSFQVMEGAPVNLECGFVFGYRKENL